MAQDDAAAAAGEAEAAAQEDANAPRIAVKAQYIQDLSFENPNAPGSLSGGEAPKVDIGVNVNARGTGGDDFEITLKITANAKQGETTVFMLELVYGGLFVVEALSVIIQVGSYKLRGKRVFKMAPLHHHFEALGWPESKIITRFWIAGLVWALLALSTLKLR